MSYVTEVKCTLTRDSVCMGDDVNAPHLLQTHIVKYEQSEQFFNEILKHYSFIIATFTQHPIIFMSHQDIILPPRYFRNKNQAQEKVLMLPFNTA